MQKSYCHYIRFLFIGESLFLYTSQIDYFIASQASFHVVCFCKALELEPEERSRIKQFDAAEKEFAQVRARTMDAMKRLMHERTTFIIAHRVSTLSNCDKVIILDKGRLVKVTEADTALVADAILGR